MDETGAHVHPTLSFPLCVHKSVLSVCISIAALPLWRTVWRLLKRLELLRDPTVPVMGIYPEKTIIERLMYPSVLAALLNNG